MQTLNIASFLIFTLAGFIGMAAHFAKKKKRGELQGRFVDYLVADYPGRTLSTVAVFLGASFTAATTGMLDGLDIERALDLAQLGQLHIPTINALVGAFMLGWMLDSGINKGV